ncbi:MAG: klhl18 [Dehalococcoidia bacterium]|nr:klhl18 [Dehalococcoidia bacterium]
MGGADSAGSALSSVEVYDPVANTWSTKSPMSTARDWAASAVVGGRIYVMGGGSGSTAYSSVESYDPATNLWTAGPPMNVARMGSSAAVVGGVIYVFGGYNNASVELNSVEAFTAP